MQTSKQYHSLALWVIMLISLSLLSACGGGSGDGGGSGSGSGDSNLDEQTPFGNVDEGKTIPINNKFLTPDPGVTLLNTENPPTEWKKGVDFHISYEPRTSSDDSDTTTTTTQQSALTLASLYQTDNDKYSGAVVTENEQRVGLGLIRDTGEALFLLDFISYANSGLILGNAFVPDPLNLDSYVGDYGCAEQGCKNALALGYQSKDPDNNEFDHDVKIRINLKNEGNKLITSVPAWFVSDRLNSEKFTVLNEVSKEFSNFGFDGSFYINYYSDPNPDNGVDELLDIYISGRLFAGSTDDVFIAGRYDFDYEISSEEDNPGYDEYVEYYGVYALEKTN